MLGSYGSGLGQRGNYANSYQPLKYSLDIEELPDEEPVTLEELKDHMRITEVDDDKVLAGMIVAARQGAEKYTKRSLVEQTWKMKMDSFPYGNRGPWFEGVVQGPVSSARNCRQILIPIPPLKSVTHIKTYSNTDVETTFDSDNYQVSTYNGLYAKPGKITLRDGVVWPTFERNADGIEIQFISGYGEPDDVPELIKLAIKEEAAYRYENRGDCGDIGSSAAISLLSQFKLERI